MAWVLAAIFGLLGIIFYGLNSWLADSFVERGWSETKAGALVAVMNAAAIPAGLLVTWLADRAGSRRLYLITASATMLLGVIGLAAVPSGAWVWAALVGMANGTLFPLILTLPLDVAERPVQVGAVVGLMLGFGYVLARGQPVRARSDPGRDGLLHGGALGDRGRGCGPPGCLPTALARAAGPWCCSWTRCMKGSESHC